MNTTGERLVDDYLARLDAALADLPSDRRREIVEEIEAHLAAAVEAAPGDEVALREALERLGEPSEIAAEARDRSGVPAREPRRGFTETAAIVLLLVGGFVAGFGWLVGVVLLWLSDVWTTRDKLIGTLVLPGGLVFPAVLGLLALSTGTSSSGGCSGVVSVTGVPQPRSSGVTCTHTGGTPLYLQVLLGALLVLGFVLPFVTAAYLARRSRPVRAA